MSLSEEASRSIQGAWGLLRLDPAAPTAFNATAEGFWRSFAAAFVLLPLSIGFQAYIGPAEGTEQAEPLTRWAVNILIYAIGWTLWPLLAFYITRALGCGDRYIGYVVAYNWSQLLTGPFLIGVGVLARMGLEAEEAAMISLAALGAALFYEYRIARQMLGVTPGKAAMLVFATLVMAEILRTVADAALQLSVGEAL
ncbi:MAG: hypothetical protein ACREIP_20210 [Alphaproteobacteria bacterium]